MFRRGYLENILGRDISEGQWEKIEAWAEKVNAYGYHGAIGGSVSVNLTPTSIGTLVSLESKVPAYHKDGTPILDRYGKPIFVDYPLYLDGEF